jgi:ABC-type amino acid transport substrate-binding protein
MPPMIALRAHCNRSNVLRTSRRSSVDPEVMMSLQEMGPATPEEEQAMTTRSGLLRAGGIAALGTAGALALASGASAARAANGSILDTWVSSKKARLGVDLTFPPLQYIDPKTKKPSGYIVELTEAMMKDVGATPEWVQTPFAQLFAALAAGKFDMIGIAVTNLPSRALQGYFADIPAFYESNVILVKNSSSAHSTADLSTAKFAVLQGSSQQASGMQIFPKGSFKAFASESDAATEVSVGRADAAIFSEFSTGSLLANNKNLRPLGGPPLFVDANTYLMPLGDEKAQHWISNWMLYQSAHQTMASGWKKWVGPSAKKYHLATSLVGTNGTQVPYQT